MSSVLLRSALFAVRKFQVNIDATGSPFDDTNAMILALEPQSLGALVSCSAELVLAAARDEGAPNRTLQQGRGAKGQFVG